ncbi:hypothetical protein [Nocardioides sp.]|uniref:hypothetical protein n=1 Tax=Nocardioides sp. TaxID=35761 RepID=UPI0025F1F76C|nr:hypothetical protein [Nocardioides sp.]
MTMVLLRGTSDRHVARVILLDEIRHMRAAFAANAIIGVRPVRAVDDHHFDSDHPAIGELQQAYAAISPQR